MVDIGVHLCIVTLMITLAGVQFFRSLLAGTLVPANTFFGLSSTTPTWEGSGVTEPTDVNYVRQAVPSTVSGWDAVVDTTDDLTAITYHAGGIPHAAEIRFPGPTGDDGTQTHLCWFDLVTAGSLLGYHAITPPLLYSLGNDMTFAAGQELLRMLGEPI